MTTRSGNAETSIEFAIDNVLERISILEGRDQQALVSEYQEWLFGNDKELDILFINYMSRESL
tara:strand:- start:81 stop:269 length:189 start_codon:yes stop_codon:yes gene_type:complete